VISWLGRWYRSAMRWSARSLTSAWVCAWDHIHSNTRHHKRPRAPRHNSAWTCGLRQRVVDSLRPSLLAQQTSTATRQLGCSGASSRMTPVLGGPCYQFCHDTQPGPTASGGGVNALSSWALRFGPVDEEDGAMLRGSCLGHLQAGSPLMIADGGGSV
jgi:hypothetical protein